MIFCFFQSSFFSMIFCFSHFHISSLFYMSLSSTLILLYPIHINYIATFPCPHSHIPILIIQYIAPSSVLLQLYLHVPASASSSSSVYIDTSHRHPIITFSLSTRRCILIFIS
ncbi:hypothetical protein METBIDRAFT_92825 [Metschnikowia bicuspidata var. bicuspidata NRRL YB-4993]|uniref:Uncharacterized protein n=1 Tax=Metschnikowia bicuspidata var. bicuspidata NRRL YB-4993 TaxID=869754 RepID=A0A1A0HFM3_9ASCO|nr:hypothetical protein METBIDRAFT_92825 [Metschnikowia bicuspidata var. bicuspidata NRRL YB-4993]OBA22801.1 hypothetical protein METBIDRAFT_92825 [Metschnikowia bicuspidata var. bicuspidata NRRL YB-4993]